MVMDWYAHNTVRFVWMVAIGMYDNRNMIKLIVIVNM